MLTYHYKCETEKCDCEFEVEQRITEKSFTLCPQCQLESLHRVIYPPIAFVKEELGPNSTVGRWAEKNTESMGKMELEDKRLQQENSRIEAKQQLQNQMSEKYGTTPIDYSKQKKPWYRKVGADKLNKLTPQQKEKYIQTGKL